MTVSSPPQGTPLAANASHEPKPARDISPGCRRTVVLTGASGGIGILIARRLLDQNYRVIALCRSKPAIESELLSHIACDLGASGSLAEACSRIHEHHAPVFAVIHCAGTISPSFMATADEKDITTQISLNLSAPILLTRHLLPLMQTIDGRQKSCIVFVNSMAAVMPLAGSAVYAAAKAGLRSFALSLAQEARPRGILVSSVFPGAVQTDMLIREMKEGGSVLNYVSTPLDPDVVAKAVTDQLIRCGSERFLPAIDGVFGRLCMLAPCLLRLSLPLLRFIGKRGYLRTKTRL
ncbi:SDR family NAD(P)-dependent oxidoreductase [Asaia prunellae]|uniref:SDR family NAD(P)-dependent oxidoreductase n=1 Tax=Asaia prunellae TaxID=610245 RepID=UPI0009FE9663|nr:SDR family oxidoreductase [Asaia prunellae]